jgi:hypothetical protein
MGEGAGIFERSALALVQYFTDFTALLSCEALARRTGVIERFYRMLLDEHSRVEGRRTWFETVEEMQTVLVGNQTTRLHQVSDVNG